MIAIKRRCKFFDTCYYAEATSETCTQKGEDYCGTQEVHNFQKRKMKKKDEQIVDARLKQLGVTPRIYHFVKDVKSFNAITIVDDVCTWKQAKREIDSLLADEGSECWHGSSTLLKKKLCQRGIYGVATFCGYQKFNRRIGRTIAKGKLAKYLKQHGVK